MEEKGRKFGSAGPLVKVEWNDAAQNIKVHVINGNEPEEHLDNVVKKTYKILPIERSPNIGGVSFKVDSTLERFSKKGCKICFLIWIYIYIYICIYTIFYSKH